MEPLPKEMLNVADPHLSQCSGPTCEREWCNSLFGGPTGEGNESYERYGYLTVDRD